MSNIKTPLDLRSSHSVASQPAIPQKPRVILALIWHRRRYRRHQEFLNWLKEGSTCADCKKPFPACCMDFDHHDPSTKAFTLAGSLNRSWTHIQAEIQKCDLVCANCHRVRTYVVRAALSRRYRKIADDVTDKAIRTDLRYGPFTSAHEGLGVLAEEVAELTHAVHHNDLDGIRDEALQVAAVALRLATCCEYEPFRQRSVP